MDLLIFCRRDSSHSKTSAMLSQSQHRLLRSLLAVVENGSAGKVTIRQRRYGLCPNSSSPQITRRLCNPLLTPLRPFTTSSVLSKKGKPPKDAPPVPDNASERGRRAEIDPYDYTELEAGIAKAIVRLKDALTKTRSAGRISPETIENLPVQLNIKHESGASGKDGKDRKESGRLGDYATVVPKGGRVMQVFVAEESVRPFPPSTASPCLADPGFYSTSSPSPAPSSPLRIL